MGVLAQSNFCAVGCRRPLVLSRHLLGGMAC
jgi:hypothetical protein